MKTDGALLRDYFEARNEAAFTELVRRHIDLVYSSALRQVGGDAHLAQDVAQNVFHDLARRAAGLVDRTQLAGWLYTSTHFAASKIVRGERSRRRREQEAHAMHEITTDNASTHDWDRLRPLLDAAMLDLNAADREAVVLRFFSGRSFADIGAALHLSEDTARKRVERALGKLHGLLARRGIGSSSAALGVVLTGHAVMAAPTGLAAAVGASVASANAATLGAGGALMTFTIQKLTTGIAALIAVGLGLLYVGKRRIEVRLKTEIAQLQREQFGVRTGIANAERRTAELRAALAAQSEVKGAPPEPRPPFTAAELASLDQTYASLFRRLRFPEDKLDRLRSLLLERQTREKDARRFAKERGLPVDDLTVPELEELLANYNRDFDDQLRSLVGENDLVYVTFFLRTYYYRPRFRPLAEMLDVTSAPLRDEQVDQLVAWTAEATPPHIKTNPMIIPDPVMMRAHAILTPFQMEKLLIVRDADAAREKAWDVNRIAAARGLLTLNAQSAEDYPSSNRAPEAQP